MSASFYGLMKYAKTGIASPEMTGYDKMKALALFGGGAVQTLTGIPPISFKADGSPLISWSMKGNGSQQGTPTPDNPIMPEFVGTLDGADWTITFTCGGQTVPVYLGQTQTVRRIKKLVLTGTEQMWNQSTAYPGGYYFPWASQGVNGTREVQFICSHARYVARLSDYINGTCFSDGSCNIRIMESNSTLQDWKTYLAQQYANGTPVTVWYVLATPETAIVNEPLAKIGDHADELHSTDAGVTIPTIKGQNTLTVDTELQPSEMTITFKG